MPPPAITQVSRRRIRLAAAVCAVLVLASCGSSATPPPGTSGSITPAPTTTDAAGASPTGSAPSSAPPDEAASSSKIDAAERAGAIDHDTALVLQLFASLDYGSLPAEYRSSNPATQEATAILGELSGRLEALPADLRAKAEPFFLRPNDPASFWQERLSRTAQVDAPGGLTLAAFTASIEMDYIDADSAPVRVWFETPRGTSEAALAAQLAREIDTSRMWEKEKMAMLGHVPCGDSSLAHNGGSSRLDVYLVYPATGLDWGGRTDTLIVEEGDANGVMVPDGPGDNGCPVATHVLLNATRDFAHLKSTAAHELFHSFQYSFRNALLSDRSWWAEASATWAKHLVYPEQNFEQDYLEPYWSKKTGAEGPLDSTEGTGEYATYILPFYLVQKSGDSSGTVVGKLWQASEAVAPIKAVGALPAWLDRFKEFALWNWNADSLVNYIDDGARIPAANLSQKPTCMDSHVVAGGTCLLKVGTTNAQVMLEHASVQYLEGIPDQPLVEKLTFDLTDLMEKPGLGIQAILTIAGQAETKVEDWTGLAKRSFCIPSEDLRRIVLVVSNSNVGEGQTQQGAIKIEALETGCSGWRGTMTGTQRWHAQDGPSTYNGVATATLDGLWAIDAAGDAECPAEPAGDCVIFRPTGTITWRWDSHVTGETSCSASKAGTVEAGADPHRDQQVLRFRVVDPDHLEYWGLGNFIAPQQDCRGPYGGGYLPSFFELLTGSSSANPADASGATCWHTTWQIDPKADTITGSCFRDKNDKTSTQFEWSLQRVKGAAGG